MVDLEASKVDVNIERFDQAFYETPIADFEKEFPQLQKRFQAFLPEGSTAEDWIGFRKDTFMIELYRAVDSVFPDLNALEKDIEKCLSYLKYHYPEFETPKVYTYVSSIDIEFPVIYADNQIFIALDAYLGPDYKGYEGMYQYLRADRRPEYIPVELAEKMSENFIGPCRDCESLLDFMIHAGKQQVFFDALLPAYADSLKFKYTAQEFQWCLDNEYNMWEYLVREELLYDLSYQTKTRFLGPAPFTKFYREEDKESPGMAGRWIGWRIVDAYRAKQDISSLKKITNTDAQTILKKSGYKPKP